MRNGPSLIVMRFCLLLAACYQSVSCQKEISGDSIPGSARLEVRFLPMVDTETLVMGNNYQNPFGEQYSVSAFKFYIHGIEFRYRDTSQATGLNKDDHYLIDASQAATASVTIEVPSATYDGISFLIGVDSIRNVSGAQTGALDPAHGMFWTWTTGYIMAKLEGNSPEAQTPNNVIEYHIGGFKGPENVIRRIHLDFPPGQQLDLKKGSRATVNIFANINRRFNHTSAIRITEKPVSMSPGPLATQIADNYATMFTVAEVTHE